MDELTASLLQAGLDPKESVIYLTLLRRGEQSASALATNAGIPRTLVYYIVSKLLERGIAAYSLRNNVKYYMAAPPHKILSDLQEKEKSFRTVLPQLEKIHSTVPTQTATVETYKGTEGYKAIIHDMFKSDSEFLILGEQGEIQSMYPVQYKQYLKQLERTDACEKVIVREDLRNKLWKSKNSDFRFISKELISPLTITIYANKVYFALWEKPIYNVLITSDKVSESFRSYFKYFWKLAKR